MVERFFFILKAFPHDIANITKIFLEHRASRSAAECAYFLTLAFFPFLICLNFLAGQLSKDSQVIFEMLTDILPSDGVLLLEEYLTYLASLDSGVIVFVGLTSLIGSGSGALRAILSIFEDIYGVIAYKSIRRMLYSIIFATLLPLIVYFSITIILLGGWVLQNVSSVLNIDFYTLLGWNRLRYFLLFLAGMLMLFFLYHFATPGKNKFHEIGRGIILGSPILFLTGAFFSKFIELSTKYSLVYGSLTSIVILMLWLYVCSNFVIIGGIINYYYTKE